MTRSILITGTCQLGSIATAFQRIFPNDHVTAHSVNEFSGRGEEGIEEIAKADFWVNMGEYPYMVSALRRIETTRTQLIKCPIFTFSAFHPDNVYLYNAETGDIPQPHYNSRIAAWAYSRNIEPGDAEKLFNRAVFSDLGFFDHWDKEVLRIKDYFEACELDFSAFFLNVKRKGVFMNCINHPKADVLVQVAKVAALKMGVTRDILQKPIEIVDSLAEQIWPVYPEIADYYGVQPSYDWVLGGPVSGGLRGYLDAYYNLYKHYGTSFEGLSFMQNGNVDALDSKYDEVLFGHLRSRA